MADTKISALPASTTPLAGTEVLPIVQGGATKQVSVANLTTGRALSATQLTLTTGNLIVASGQGIDFSATPGTGTSELLADYEEGTYSPSVSASSGAIATLGAASGSYTKVGRVVHAFFDVSITLNGTGAGSILIANIPFAPSAANTSMGVFREQSVNGKMGSVNLPNTTQFQLQFYDNSYPGSSGCRFVGQITYYT